MGGFAIDGSLPVAASYETDTERCRVQRPHELFRDVHAVAAGSGVARAQPRCIFEETLRHKVLAAQAFKETLRTKISAFQEDLLEAFTREVQQAQVHVDWPPCSCSGNFSEALQARPNSGEGSIKSVAPLLEEDAAESGSTLACNVKTGPGQPHDQAVNPERQLSPGNSRKVLKPMESMTSAGFQEFKFKQFPRYLVRHEIHDAYDTSQCTAHYKSADMHRKAILHSRRHSLLVTTRPWWILPANHRFLVVWNWCCLCLLVKDLFVVPADWAFDLYRMSAVADVLLTAAAISRFIWTTDFILAFFTSVEIEGHECFDPRIIRHMYFKGWFMPDLGLVTSEWALYWLQVGTVSPASLLRCVRLFRIMRVFRLARLVAVKRLTFHAMRMSAGGLSLLGRLVTLVICVILQLHFVACGYFIVFERKASIVSDRGLLSDIDDAADAYMISVFWSVSQFIGNSDMYPVTRGERVFCVIVRIMNLITYMVMIGYSSHAVAVCNASNSVQMTRISHVLLERYGRERLTPSTIKRMKDFVANYHRTGVSDGVIDERFFLESLPEALRSDLHYEVRGRLLRCIFFFAHIDTENSRVLREIANKAVAENVVAPLDAVFAAGDPGEYTYIISGGNLEYRRGADLEELHPGQWIAEAVMWTHWEHLGDCEASSICTLLQIDAGNFHRRMRNFPNLSGIVEKYARSYVKQLNAKQDECSDHMDLNWEMKDFLNVRAGSSVMDHHIFLSHHKRDAGPEAALMADGLEKILGNDQEFIYPVFIDSENLVDLRHLKEHVRRSDVVLLLLTNEVLFRPWCLVEIVTAFANQIPIFPVLIQKEGCAFDYPDEAYYEQLASGRGLSLAAQQLLRQEQVDLNMLEQAIRRVFCRIAKPFSPNKPQRTRVAELQDIVALVLPRLR